MHKEILKCSEYFKDHELEIETEFETIKSYLCKRKNSSSYSFRVIFAPSYISVYGDIGNLVLRPYDFDSLRWLLDTNKNEIDYIMSKVPNEFRSSVKKYSVEKAKKILVELKDEIKQELIENNEYEDELHVYQTYKQIYNEKKLLDKRKNIRKLYSEIQNLSEEEFCKRFINDINDGDPERLPDLSEYIYQNYYIVAGLIKFCELYNENKGNNIK